MGDLIKDKLDADPNRRSPMFTGLTGRGGADVTGKASATPDLRGMLRAAYGPGPRSDVNTTAAAKSLGVSKRTVERWLASSSSASSISKPKAQTLSKLVAASRKAATTKAGRIRAMKTMRNSQEGKRLMKHGGVVQVKGVQGVHHKKHYVRWRAVNFPPQDILSPAEIDALWKSYEQNGEEGASQWLTSYARQNYAAGWEFEKIDSVRLIPQ